MCVYLRTRDVFAAFLFGTAALALGSCSSAEKSERPAPAPTSQDSDETPPKVLFIGTSLTAGYGLDPLDAYPEKVRELAAAEGVEIEVINAGVSGETSAGAIRRIGWVLAGKPDIVVIETGANDGLRGLPVADLRTNLAGIVDSIKAALPDARIVIMSMEAPPNLGGRYLGEFRDVYEEVAGEAEVVNGGFLLAGVAGLASLNQSDGIHPNAEGAKIVAKTVWNAIAPVVREPLNR